jgi:ABC-type uncharacterized transport system permease subunit
MDFLIGFSGIMAAGALVWITVAPSGAILIGGAVAGVFGSISFGLSPLAKAAEKRHDQAAS